MNLPTLRSLALCAFLASCGFFGGAFATAQEKSKQIPDALKPWESWATWDDGERECPASWQDPKKRFCFWPSRLELQADHTGGHFSLTVSVYHEGWVALPGGKELWPQTVKANGGAVPVVEHEGDPSVHLPAGVFKLEGTEHWDELPQRIAIPPDIGILALTIDGKPVDSPVWDADGYVWLKRTGSAEEADKNFLAVNLYAALEDGIPLWLHTEVELTVTGKSREEELGNVLPEGWKLAAVKSPIPVAVDDSGRMKAQVRTGKWEVHLDAFRFDNPKEIRYAEKAKPAASEELVAFRPQPDLRLVEIQGPPSIDVSQTEFPKEWKDLPVYRWDTSASIQIEERMRGMGQQKPSGLTVEREWWLDENGAGLTFRDKLSGVRQQIWRLDAATGQVLGSVRSGGEGQLITRNPQTGAPGVEIRSRNVDLEATGRTGQLHALSAVGWQTDADGLRTTLNLPPGWRLFALFGADWVQGDWLTSWTLLDLFLLVIFSLAVFRLWGFVPAAIAFAAFGISYHEPGAPRYSWLVLLVPLALEKLTLEGWARRLRSIFKWVTITVLILILIPFVVGQIQQALYPQLEQIGENHFAAYNAFSGVSAPGAFNRAAGAPITAPAPPSEPEDETVQRTQSVPTAKVALPPSQSSNMRYDSKARIQTGPALPQWTWRSVSFGWNGPVRASQEVRPILISLGVERLLTVLRATLLVLLAGVLLGGRSLLKIWPRFIRKTPAAILLLLSLGCVSTTSAQTEIPDQETLNALRTRLLETSDAYPNAAEIPYVALTINKRHLTIDAEVHAAVRVAAPLPRRLPAWSPVSVLVDDKPEPALRREDGFLWVVLGAGVHHVKVEGLLANVTEWEWTYLLKPRQVKIDAPGWSYTGVRPGGEPEQQVFFTLEQKAVAGQASYDRQEVQSVVQVDRNLELGLIWQVHNVVTRISPPGKAISLRIPLLPGESVLSGTAVVKDGLIEVRLGAEDTSFAWESSLAVANQLKLATRPDDNWVERWHVLASPVWNIAISGLPPTFEPAASDLVPVWQPWPGESADLSISRPEAIAGATVTVSRASEQISLGSRQRSTKLELSLRCSLGEDFPIEMPAAAEITTLELDNKALPVRRDGARLVIPLHPGEQTVDLEWKTDLPLHFRAAAEQVRLPVEASNIDTIINVPENRWVLGASGPRQGPAVRFWGILLCSILAALALGRIPHSPLRELEWVLLVIGLTQVALPAALVVVGWLFLLSWRGRSASVLKYGPARFTLLQVFLILLTIAALCIFIVAVGEGLGGNPEMFIEGYGSSRTALNWFQPRSDGLLPQPACYSISLWWYRLSMLLWALWLAFALIRWLRSGWESFSRGGCFQKLFTMKPSPAKGPDAPAPPQAPPTSPPSASPPPPPLPPKPSPENPV